MRKAMISIAVSAVAAADFVEAHTPINNSLLDQAIHAPEIQENLLLSNPFEPKRF